MFDRLLIFHRKAGLTESELRFTRSITARGFRVDHYGGQHTVFCEKNKLQTLDCREYGVRVSTAEEIYVHQHQVPADDTVVLQRKIQRFSFLLLPNLRLDMSYVTSGPAREESFEVELELVPPFKFPNEMMATLLYACHQMVSYIQDSRIVATVSETDGVRQHIRDVLQCKRFAHVYGAQ